MARPKRNNRDGKEGLAANPPLSCAYHTAAYARLSVEDNGCDSDSIENQIRLLKRYIANGEDLTLASVFYDNGATGTNFDRPGFTAMLDEVKKGKINCIVVKDLSRFGRNYMETGHYLEKIFPCLGVRFISINDHYDSICVTANQALALSLKNIYHHIYAKDISRKICTVLDAKKKQGLFLGSFAPYGYQKSEDHRYKLEVEEETAGVVRDIFQMRLEGIGVAAIARILNDQAVPSHHKMLWQRGLIKDTNGQADALWSSSSVKSILENPIYLGCTVERKGDYAYYKGGQKRKLSPQEWNCIQHTHEALVDKETFETVQQLLQASKQGVARRRKPASHRERTENILRGLLICGDCKKRMCRDAGYYNANGKLLRHRFYCSGKYRKQGSCQSVSAVESQLLSTLFYLINVQLALLADTKKRMWDTPWVEHEKDKDDSPPKKRNLELEVLQIKKRVRELYGDYKQGLISESAYGLAQSKWESKQRELELRLEEWNQKEISTTTVAASDTDQLNEIASFPREKVPSRAMCLALLESIVVYNDRIVVHYTFRSEYQGSIPLLFPHGGREAAP